MLIDIKKRYGMFSPQWIVFVNPSQMTNLDSSKLKEFAEDNFEVDKSGRKSSKRVENTVFKRLVPKTSKNQGFIGKGLTL